MIFYAALNVNQMSISLGTVQMTTHFQSHRVVKEILIRIFYAAWMWISRVLFLGDCSDDNPFSVTQSCKRNTDQYFSCCFECESAEYFPCTILVFVVVNIGSTILETAQRLVLHSNWFVTEKSERARERAKKSVSIDERVCATVQEMNENIYLVTVWSRAATLWFLGWGCWLHLDLSRRRFSVGQDWKAVNKVSVFKLSPFCFCFIVIMTGFLSGCGWNMLKGCWWSVCVYVITPKKSPALSSDNGWL